MISRMIQEHLNLDLGGFNIRVIFLRCNYPPQATMATMGVSEKLALINENLAEVLNPEIIKKILDEERNVKIYWGEEIRSLILRFVRFTKLTMDW